MGKFATEFVMLLCWAGPVMASAAYTSSGLTSYKQNFLNIFRGVYNNLAQTREIANKNALLRLQLLPVDIVAFRPAPVVYNELSVDGVVVDRLLLVVYVLPGPTIQTTIYNVTNNASAYKSGEFDVSTLRDRPRSDFGYSNCSAIYKRLNETLYVGSFPDCRTVINGNYLSYADTVTCDSYSTLPPPTASFYSPVPSILRRQGKRPPVIGVLDIYDRICGSSNSATSTKTPRTTTRKTTTSSYN